MSRDPLEEIFQSLDPTKELTDEQIGVTFSMKRLLDQIGGSERISWIESVRRRMLRRSVMISTIAVLVLAGAATAITLVAAPVRTVAHITCYQNDSLKSTADVTSYGGDPLAICARVMHWRVPQKVPHRPGILCVLSDGSLSAFPPSSKSEDCVQFGLKAFNGRPADPHLAAFQQATENYFSKHHCESPQDAKGYMLRLLGRYGLMGWHVETSGSHSSNACATLAFEVNGRRVEIVGIARMRLKRLI